MRPYLLLALPLLAALVPGLSIADNGMAATLFVATNGNDAWSGRLTAPNAAHSDGPLATLVGARDAVRRMRASLGLQTPIWVLIRGGLYSLSEPFTLGPEDSGTEAGPITYAAYPGEKPVISGGSALKGWHKQADGKWTLQVRGARSWDHSPRALFIDGKRRTLARSPNTGYFHIAGKSATDTDPATGKKIDPDKQGFRYSPSDLKGLSDLKGADAVILYHWETGHFPISAVDEANETLVLTGKMNWPFWGDQRYYIENSMSCLDAPGEWYLDKATETLYYIPFPGEDPTKETAILPRLTQLVLMNGDPEGGKFVDDIHFEGLQFRYADYALEPEGHCDWQAAVTIPAVIQAVGARRCSLDRCEVSHIDNYGIWFRSGCSDNKVTQCELTDIGAGGVRLGEGGNPATENTQTKRNTVSNNFIHDIGIIFKGAIGIWVGQSSDNVLSHNEICDTNYSAISVGWTWGYGPTTAHNNIIEYNHLHHLCRGVMSDMGAIYTLGTSPGTIERNNLIHDVWCYTYGGGGIYPDEGSSEILVENNIVYHTVSGGLTFHYGQNCTVRNNIFAFGRDQQVVRGRDEEHIAFNFERNIVYYDSGDTWSAGGPHHNWTADYNCYWNASGAPLKFQGMTWEEWRKAGFDLHGINADPQFINPKAADFRLKPDSPALKLGFQPIDMSTVGLVGPKEWTDLPKRIKRAPIIFGVTEATKPHLIDDGFEKTPVGATAEGAVTWGETATATVRVTDEVAATGKHSLKFQDQAGLDQPWNPHIWYSPYLSEGVARLQYDVRLQPGAPFWNEWRDTAATYHVGPSLGADAEGQLSVGGRKVAKLPADTWVHIDTVCGLGKSSTHTYDVTITIPGQTPVKATDVACDPSFTRLEWLGFISNTRTRVAFYIDNVKLELLKGK